MKYLILAVALLSQISCRKDEGPVVPDLFSGTYKCQVHTYSWMLGSYDNSNNYEANVNVTFNNDSLSIENYGWKESALLVHEDSTIRVNSGSSFQLMVKFTNDSLYFFRSSGGLGGQSGVSLKGWKID